jgi:hypothetical protein
MANSRLILAGVLLLALSHLTRADKFTQTCTADIECHEVFGPKYECGEAAMKCVHEALFPFKGSLTLTDVVGFVLVILGAGIANSGGIGGGVMFTPVFIFLFGYTFQASIPLAKATIFAGSLANLFIIIRKPHPKKAGEYLVDYGLSSVIIPIVLPGTVTGVILNKTLPPILVLVIMTFYLVKTTLGILNK